MTIVDYEPSHFEGKDGKMKFRKWLKSLTRVQLLELNDMDVLPEDGSWGELYDEENGRSWPIDHELRDDYLSEAFNNYAKGPNKDAKTFENTLDRLVPQVAGIQKKLDRLLSLIGDTELKVTVKDALKL